MNVKRKRDRQKNTKGQKSEHIKTERQIEADRKRGKKEFTERVYSKLIVRCGPCFNQSWFQAVSL